MFEVWVSNYAKSSTLKINLNDIHNKVVFENQPSDLISQDCKYLWGFYILKKDS